MAIDQSKGRPGALNITLNVYSGMPNPNWDLDEREAAMAEDRILSLMTEGDQPQPPGLGYQGFSVSRRDESGNLVPLTLGGGQLLEANKTDAAVPLNVFGNNEVENFLLNTAHGAVDDDLAGFVSGSFDAAVLTEDAAPKTRAACPPCGGGDAPAYNPGPWNVQPTLRNNNCYNYANNQMTNTFAQPGRASGVPMTAMSCAGVQPSATADGLRAVPNFQASTSGWYVALVIWPGNDFHWYRQDDNGCWSHKPGSTPVRNFDNSGNQITDPQFCDRGPYVNFCTYMVTHAGVNIR